MKTELTLSLSGGAARCAFQGGFIFELANQGFTFDRIYAISGGTISGYFAAIGRAEDLEKVWLQEIPKHAGKIRWYAGAIVNLLSGADGIISRDFVEGLSTNFIQNMPTNLVFRVVSLVDGAEYDLTANDFENLADYRRALYAAVAIPGVFPSINFRTKKGVILDAVDGGLYSPIITTIGDDQPLNIMTHSREVEIKRVDGIAGAAARALYLRDFDRTYIEVGEYPGFPLADPWDFRQKSIATSFFHGQQRAKDWINRQIES